MEIPTSKCLEYLLKCDPLTGFYEFQHQGQTYQLTKNKSLLDGERLFLINNREVVGIIDLASEKSGEIRTSSENPGDLTSYLGEYLLEHGKYTVTPYSLESGALRAERDKKEQIHPLDWLMRYLQPKS